MLENFKARVQKYWGIPYQDLTNIIRWLSSPVVLSNPNLQIASVENARNETFCYVPFEKLYVVPAYAVSPEASPSEALHAGNLVDSAIECEAQREGITRVLLMLSPEHPPMVEEKVIRVVERTVERNDALFDVGWPVKTLATPYVN